MTKRRMITFLLPALAMLALAGGAWAYFSSSGTGTGSGAVKVTVAAVSVTGQTATQSLLPTGAATGDVKVTLTNGNAGSVHINSLALDTSQGTSGFSSSAAGCALSFASQTNGGSGWTIAANSSQTVDLTNSVTMGTTAASSCQGQSFTVYLKAS